MNQHIGARTGSQDGSSPGGAAQLPIGPGKQTLTMGLPPAAGATPGTGVRMPEAVQAKMERAMGADFSAVRIHEGPQAGALGAQAYTQGTDIHFAPGQYRPDSAAGQELLGHELAHVVQQASGRVAAPAQAKGAAIGEAESRGVGTASPAGPPGGGRTAPVGSIDHDAGLEREADELGARAAAGAPAGAGNAGAASRMLDAVRPASATGAIQCKLTTTGLAPELDAGSPEARADAILEKLAAHPSHRDLVARRGAPAVRDTLIAMIKDEVKDHGTFPLGTGMGQRRLINAIEMQFPPPVFEKHQVVEDNTAVGFVVEAHGEDVVVQWVRSLKANEDSQSYLEEPPGNASARDLRPSTARIVRDLQQARAPEHHMVAASEPAFGKPTRERAPNRKPSATVHDRQSKPEKLQRPPEHQGRPAPKDFSFVPRAMHMQFSAADKAGAAHIEQMALIGLQEGFRITLLVAEDEMPKLRSMLSDEARRNITVNVCEHPPMQWAEDSGEHHVDGSVHVPSRVPNNGPTAPEDAMREGRDQRGFYMHPSDRTDGDVTRIGAAVASRSSQKEKVATGLAGEARGIFENRSYIEGGNMLTGTHANGQPYALIGMDALYATRKQLIHGRSGPASASDLETVTAAVSKDIGIAPAHIHFVEQPGEFHIDMKLAVMGPGQVVVNDAFKVFDLQQKWILDDYEAQRGKMPEDAWRAKYPAIDGVLAELSLKAQRAWRYESRTVENLMRIPGLKVARVAANFPAAGGLPKMNFLNGEGGRGLDDSPFFVTNGGDPRAEAYIAKMYLVKLNTGLQRLYFLDREYSKDSLLDDGGIGCRTKGEGGVQKM